MTDSPLTIFQVAGRAMSAQLVRMNTTASNLANAGGIASSADAAYKTIKPVFRTQYDNATGLATVNVERIVPAGEDRKSDGEGKSESVSVDLGWRRYLEKKHTKYILLQDHIYKIN